MTGSDMTRSNTTRSDTTPITPKRMRVHHFGQMKQAGQKFAMLTSYDTLTAQIFDEAGIETILVGDSLGNTVLGYDSTLPVDLAAMALFTRAVASHVHRALIVGDMPFGSYEASDADAVRSAVTLMKAGAHAVKLEGGARSASRIRAIVDAGIPVVAHIGLTPQSEHALGGFRVQGREVDAERHVIADARAVQEAGAFAVVLELMAADVATSVTAALDIPTIGIGAGSGCDGQVLVWQDFAGLTDTAPRFVRRYAQVRESLRTGAEQFHADVVNGTFPDATESFGSQA